MTKDEALRLALEAWESGEKVQNGRLVWIEYDSELVDKAITAIKAALEAKDEPVAWMRTSGTGSPVVTEELLAEMPEMRWNFQQPLYTTPPQRKPLTVKQPEVRTGNCLRVGVCASEGHKIPPQRTWVGLTDEETNLLWENTDNTDSWELIKKVEAKLKEKNT
jgi:hypothetical protein